MRRLALPALSTYCLVLMFMAASAFAAEDWLTISTNASNISFAIDKASIERTGSTVQFWEKMVFSKPDLKDEGSGKLIKEKRVQRMMHCQNHRQAVIYGAIYGEDGSFITSTSFDEEHRELIGIPPGTVAEAEFNLLCAKPSGTFFGVDFDR